MQKYPQSWPKADKHRPNSLPSVITEEQKLKLYNRIITTRALSIELNVHEKYLSSLFPGKIATDSRQSKRKLIEARQLYKLELAKDVLQGKYSINQVKDLAHVSYNTVLRYMQRAKALHPELAILYKQRKTHGLR